MPETRYHAIDKLRAAMILTVVFGHAMLPYVTVPRRYQDQDATILFDVVGLTIYSFAMQVFFVTAGFSAALLLQRRGARGLIRNRWRRIFLPFIAAWIVLAPLTRAAYQFARNAASDQTIQAGIEAVSRGNWLDWGKIYHLWFLPALFLFTLMALGCHKLVHGAGPRVSGAINNASRRFLASPWRTLLLTLILAVAVVPPYVFGESVAKYGWKGISLFGYFVLGWLLYRQRDLLPSLARQYWLLIIIALLAVAPTIWATRLRLFAYGDIELLTGLVAGFGNAVIAACLTFGLLGLAQARGDQPSSLWRYFSEASYWIYLVHFPFVLVVGGALSVISMPAVIKYVLTVLIVFPIVVGSYHYGVRRPALARGGRNKDADG